MKRKLCWVIGLTVALLAAWIQPAFAADVSDSPDNAKAVKVNTTYTHTFEEVGDEDYFTFVSAGGTYEVKVWDPTGCAYVCSFSESCYNDTPVGAHLELRMSWSEEPVEPISLDEVKEGTEFLITFEGDYEGEYSFKIIGKATSSSEPTKTVKLTSSNTKVSAKNVKYTGKQCKPSVTVEYKGKKLKKGTDYTVSYANNVEVGKATVKVKGKGKYTGAVKGTFKIKPKGKIYALSFGAAKGESPTSTNNVKVMNKAFLGLKIPGYSLSKSNVVMKNYKGFSKKQLLNAVEKTFKNTTSSDISFIYINAHGKECVNKKGAHKFPGIATGEGYYDYYAWYDVLEDLSSRIDGKIVLLPEMCFSGNLVMKAKTSTVRNRIVILSAASTNKGANQIKLFFGKGKYTTALSHGLGNGAKRLAADKNGNGKVTLGELGGYINKKVKTGQGPMSYYGGSLDKFVIYKK